MTEGTLAGRAAVVTGGAKSLGKAFAAALAAQGAAVAIGDIVGGGDVAGEISQSHKVDCFAQPLDVSDERSVRDFTEAVLERFGKIDILVNNAAIFASARLGPFEDAEVGEWQRIMAVNVIGSFLMAKHIGPAMMKAGYGRIINIGSGTAYKGMPGMTAYVTSKAAILGLTRSLARELGPHGVTVNTLAMGLIESESVRGKPEHLAYSDRVIASRAIQREGVPEDPLGALLFLASDASGFVTGQTLMVDGGSVTL